MAILRSGYNRYACRDSAVCDTWARWALQLRISSTKFPLHYLVGSQALICLSEMRNGILNRNQTTWANTDTRLTTRAFYDPTINREIDIRETGCVGKAFNDSMAHLWNMGELKHEKGAAESIFGSKSLIHGHRMGSNSAENPKMSVPLADRITKTSIYGKRRKSETDLEIGKIKKALSDFAKQAENKMIGEKSNIRREGIKFRKIEKVGN